VVQIDAQRACRIKHVPEGVLHLHSRARQIGEEVIAHGHGSTAGCDDVVILKRDGRPILDGEARVLCRMVVRGDEVGQGTLERRSELPLRCQRWLEKDTSVAVRVKRRDVVVRNLFEVLAVDLRGRNPHDAVAPLLLRILDHVPRHAAGCRHVGELCGIAAALLASVEVLHFPARHGCNTWRAAKEDEGRHPREELRLGSRQHERGQHGEMV